MRRNLEHLNKSQGGYDAFDRLSSMKKYYSRRRTVQFFLLTDKGIKFHRPICAVCGEPITVESGNRGQYHPKRRQHILMHYKCAWSALAKDWFGAVDRK